MNRILAPLLVLAIIATGSKFGRADDPPAIVPTFRVNDQGSDIAFKTEGDRLVVQWPTAMGESASISFNLRPGQPLIESLRVGDANAKNQVTLVKNADPVAAVTVGSREQAKNRPPNMSVFNEFFDNPHKRPSSTHDGELTLKSISVFRDAKRATIRVESLKLGPFAGSWRFTVYAGSRLIKLEAIVKTEQDRVAFLYELGLRSPSFGQGDFAWIDTDGQFVSNDAAKFGEPSAKAVRHRAIGYGSVSASLVLTPPPHQFFFPRDYTNNVHTVFVGGKPDGPRTLGVRQDSTGGGAFVPWFNAPPGTEQKLSMFLHVAPGNVENGLAKMREYTRNDRFADLPGHLTYTSHYHMAITVAAMKALAEGRPLDKEPEYARMFKEMNVNAVHLGEFHGDGHQYDSGPVRLQELKAEFDECRRVSDAKLLVIPGEEIARFIGKAAPERESGHWMSLFPKPVYWILERKPGQPFVTEDPTYGKVYRVGSSEDVQKVLDAERGLIWTAHPRIKSSSWAPDAFFDEPYFKAETFLGAAWKAMPADLSQDRLGTRGLTLLNDMANMGLKKYLPGEVDVFTLDHTHELYGHMNINYLRLDRLPKFDEGWEPIVNALRGGEFFTTTGEVLITDFTFDGVKSGETVTVDPSKRQQYRIVMDWTYPLSYAEVIVGDGENVRRDRTALHQLKPFGRGETRGVVDLTGAKWIRVEVWDVAGNGAYSQPVWLK